MVAASHMEEEQSESGDSNIPADRNPKQTKQDHCSDGETKKIL